jgi:uncharacterized membrane protein (Fun14 family)
MSAVSSIDWTTTGPALVVLLALLKLRVISVNWDAIASALTVALAVVKMQQQLNDEE